jgi:hypothetical protein
MANPSISLNPFRAFGSVILFHKLSFQRSNDFGANIGCVKRDTYSRLFFSAFFRASKETVVDWLVSG